MTRAISSSSGISRAQQSTLKHHLGDCFHQHYLDPGRRVCESWNRHSHTVLRACLGCRSDARHECHRLSISCIVLCRKCLLVSWSSVVHQQAPKRACSQRATHINFRWCQLRPLYGKLTRLLITVLKCDYCAQAEFVVWIGFSGDDLIFASHPFRSFYVGDSLRKGLVCNFLWPRWTQLLLFERFILFFKYWSKSQCCFALWEWHHDNMGCQQRCGWADSTLHQSPYKPSWYFCYLCIFNLCLSHSKMLLH